MPKKNSNRSVTCESIWMNWFCTFVVTVVVSGNQFQLLEKRVSVAIPPEIDLFV